ncbi:MAG: division/cell wall cluster transcriptional repressor MraZ [Candidatus Merdivicinus sp.]
MAGLLIGEYACSMDAKGRLNFPAKLREDLGERFILSKGLGDRCLCVYPMAEWECKQEKLRSLPASQAAALQRYLFSSASEAEPDKQGRIVIPQNLREFIGSEKDVMVIGSDNRCEIWSKKDWEQTKQELDPEFIKTLIQTVGF